MIREWLRSKIQALFQVVSNSNSIFTSSEVEENVKNFYNSLTLIYRGMNNLLEFGNSGIQNVITYRRSWIMSKDTKVSCEDEYEAEEEWIEAFERHNKMNILRQRFATNGEIEGKVLIVLMVDAASQMIVPRVFNFVDYFYEIDFNEFGEPVQVRYTLGNKEYKVGPDRFIYCTMTMSENYLDHRITPSSVFFVLEQIINSDKAYQNWRYVNDRFAKTTPMFEMETWQDASKVSQILNGKSEDLTNPHERGKKWKVGEGLAFAKGKSYTLDFNADGIESLKGEITACAQKISGHTGIPIFLLGFPELIGGGRATAEEMAEAITNKTITERIIWEEKLKEVYSKAMILSNEYFGTTLNPDCISVRIPPVSLAEINSMITTYESAVDKKYISKRTFRDMLPGIDNDEEEERLAEENASAMAQMTGAMSGLGDNMPMPKPPIEDEEDV